MSEFDEKMNKLRAAAAQRGLPLKTKSTALKTVDTATLREWMRAARRNVESDGDGSAPRLAYRPPGWGRYFTIDNLSAEFALRPDADEHRGSLKRKRKQERQAKAAAGRSRSERRAGQRAPGRRSA